MASLPLHYACWGCGCTGVRCSIIASIFAHTFFRPPSFHPSLLCSNADAAACAAVPLLPLFRERDATESETTQQHRPARSAKLRTTARCPRTKTILNEGAGCEWVIQNAQHRLEDRSTVQRTKINRLIYVECRGMASIRTDSHGAHHRHTHYHRSQQKQQYHHQLFQQLATRSFASEPDGQGRGSTTITSCASGLCDRQRPSS